MSADWAPTTIGDCLENQFPGEWGSNPGPAPANASVLRSTNLDDDGHVDLASGASRVIAGPKLAQKQLQEGDVLLEASGGGPGKPVGRVALFRNDGKGPYLCSNFFRTLRPNGATHPGFLAYRLLHLHRQPRIWHYQQQTTGIINLKYVDYLAHQFKVPPLPEQRRIAEVLDTVDEAIRKTEQVIAKLQEMKQGLLHDLLTRGIDENGELRDPERHPEQFKDSPLGRIPRGWGPWPLREVLAFITDYRGMTPPYTEDGIAVLSAENIGGGKVKSVTKYVSPETYRRTTTRGFPEPGDTIFTTEAPVAEVAQLPDDRPYRLTRRLIALRPKPTLQKDFLFWSMYRLSRTGAWNGKMHGSTVPRILKPDVLDMVIAVAPAPEQTSICSILNTHQLRLDKEKAQTRKLHTLKQALMDDLLTGRVRVPLDEPPR